MPRVGRPYITITQIGLCRIQCSLGISQCSLGYLHVRPGLNQIDFTYGITAPGFFHTDIVVAGIIECSPSIEHTGFGLFYGIFI